MTTKYHVSPDGKVRVCEAHDRPCTYGALSVFDTLEQANKQAESIKALLFGTNKADSRSVSLSEITDIELLNKMISQGYIAIGNHPDDDTLKIMCYSRTAQMEAKWNSATKLARGLIVQSSTEDFDDAVIVQRPWSKFYTLSQMVGPDGKAGWAFGDEENMSAAQATIDLIDFDAPAEVTDKRDGSMLVLYAHPKTGKPQLATKGSFTSDQAVMFSKLAEQNEQSYNNMTELLQKHDDTTFVFEGTGPDNQIVLPYETDEISLLGAIKKRNGVYLGVNDVSDIWKGNVTETMPAKTLREALALPDRKNREGVVVRMISDDPNKQLQIKIKQDDYLVLHRAFASMSKKAVFELVSSGKYDEIEGELSTYVRNKHAKSVAKWRAEHDRIVAKADEAMSKITSEMTRKDIAMMFKHDSEALNLVFAKLKGRDISALAWKTIKKHRAELDRQ